MPHSHHVHITKLAFGGAGLGVIERPPHVNPSPLAGEGRERGAFTSPSPRLPSLDFARDRLSGGGEAGVKQTTFAEHDHMDGKKIFVEFAAPGDTLEVEITRDHGSFAEAHILRVVEPAPCRVMPVCPVFGRCGGCQWQHLSYATQLEWKSRILAETLTRIGGIADPHVLPTLPSPIQWNYRNRIQLHVDSKGHVGFYRPKSKEVVEFERCYIADERLNEQLAAHRAEFATRDRGVSLKVDRPSPSPRLPRQGGGEAVTPRTKFAGSHHIDGPHFSQVNTAQNIAVQKILVEWAGTVPHTRIVELYAGSGNFTFPLAAMATHIVAAEIDGRAIAAAKDRAVREGISNIEFICAPAERIVKKFRGACDLVFLDPPRKGAAEALDAIMALAPTTIIYMSCDPATMARDVRTLTASGWTLVQSLPIDMFPQTFHIESLNLLVRK